MDLTQLKTQVMTLFMVKSNQNPGGGYNDIYTMLYTMVVMNLIEQLFRAIPTLWLQFQAAIRAYFFKKTLDAKQFLPSLVTKEKEEVFSISMKRQYGKGVDENNKFVEKVDGVIEYLCNINTSKHIQLERRYILNTSDEIQVTAAIKAKVHGVAYDDKGDLQSIELTIFSTQLKINELRDWVDEVHRNYVYEKNNKLGNKKFFFNEIPSEPQKQIDVRAPLSKGEKPKETYNWSTAPKQLTFTMNEFHTFKSFSNVFGAHVAELKERLNLFVHHPEWYSQRGIPHSLGILLHGIPGAGKTSTIKAIARDTGRHIFNLSLRSYTTQKQLMNLFYNESVAVNVGTGNPVTYNIPVNQRLYVIEDIDCLTNVVYDREMTKTPFIGDGEGITLSFLLNLLDGVLETPGRILVITSNYPERLDKALTRPGRIDVKIEFSKASREMILEMMNNFYTESLTLEDIPADLDSAISPAEVLESLCTHFKSWDSALQHMKSKLPTIPSNMYLSSLSASSETGASCTPCVGKERGNERDEEKFTPPSSNSEHSQEENENENESTNTSTTEIQEDARFLEYDEMMSSMYKKKAKATRIGLFAAEPTGFFGFSGGAFEPFGTAIDGQEGQTEFGHGHGFAPSDLN